MFHGKIYWCLLYRCNVSLVDYCDDWEKSVFRFNINPNGVKEKYGFWDGDYFPDIFTSEENHAKFLDVVDDSHQFLYWFFKKYVMSKCDQEFEVYYMHTSHNPVRIDENTWVDDITPHDIEVVVNLDEMLEEYKRDRL